jgi:hypothetical protein
MIRFVKYSLLLAAPSTACWGQFKVTGIVPTRNQPPAAPANHPADAQNGGVQFNGIQYNGGPVTNSPHGVNV